MSIDEHNITIQTANHTRIIIGRSYDPDSTIPTDRFVVNNDIPFTRTMNFDLRMIQDIGSIEHYKSKFNHLIEYAKNEGIDLWFTNLDSILQQLSKDPQGMGLSIKKRSYLEELLMIMKANQTYEQDNRLPINRRKLIKFNLIAA